MTGELIGTTVQATVLRRGERMQVQLVPAELDD
jgi:hypothetical protein